MEENEVESNEMEFMEYTHEINWTWDRSMINRSSVSLSNKDKDVEFHRDFSSGTAGVRGFSPFKYGHHYFWEIKMLSYIYGTDVMVGVGTNELNLSQTHKFCSLLGSNNQSWGYSYRGVKHHDGEFERYGDIFRRGSVIGVHLDMCSGTLEFYHNGEPLGVAYSGLTKFDLYPMITSTAARSSMRILSATSYPKNLQMDCLLRMSVLPQVYQQLQEIPWLKRIAKDDFWWIIPRENKEYYSDITDLDLQLFGQTSTPSLTCQNFLPLTFLNRMMLRDNSFCKPPGFLLVRPS